MKYPQTPFSWKAPGQWSYSSTYAPYVTSDLYTIPLSDIDGGVNPGTTIYLMVHSTIYQKGIQVGSAYSLFFKGSFSYVIQEEPPEQQALFINKTGPLEAYPGGTYLYTIVVTNAGNCAVENVNITDKLPNEVKPAHPAAPGTPTGVYDAAKNMVNWTLGTIGVNGIVVITLEVIFESSLTPGAKLTNNATAFGKDAEPVWDTWDTIVTAGPRLNIEKVGPTVSYPGGIITYTTAVRNVGSETAYNVQVDDAIDLSLVEYVSSTPTGTVSADKIIWNLGTLNKGVTVLITLTVKIQESVFHGTTITDSAEVTWEDDTGQEYGPESCEWVTTAVSHPILSIVKTGPLNAYPKQIVEYTISVVNLNGSSALNVIVSDRLPTGVELVSASPTPTSSSGQWVDWTIPEIGAGETHTFTVRVNMTVYPTNCQTVTNNVTVVWEDTFGATYGPLWDSFVTRVGSVPLLIIEKTGDSRGTLGQTLSFTINVTNIGGSNATNVKVWDDLPLGMHNPSCSPPYASFDSNTGRITWELSEIEPGETVSISLTAEVASVSYDGIWLFNNVYANWTDGEETLYGPVTDIHPLQLFENPYAEISKSGVAEAIAGSTITYKVTIHNPTLNTLSHVMLVDYLPARVSYVSSNPTGTYDSVAHKVVWDSLSLDSDATLTFEVTVKIDSDLFEGAFIFNEAIVTWPEGSDKDISSTIIHAKPPVGGIVVNHESLQIFAEAIIAVTAIMVTIASRRFKARISL